MTSGLVLLIIAIILVIIIAYLIGILIRKRNDMVIAKLEERKNALFTLPINEEIETVKGLHLIGQSQTSFREWNQKWVDLSLNSFGDIENHIFEVESYNDTFNFIKAKHEIKGIETQLDVIEEDIKSIREGLAVLREQEDKNSSRVTYALDMYEELQNSISQQENHFGSAMGEITKQLVNIQTEFSQFVTLNTSGDPIEAAEILEKAEEHTIALGQITEKVPAIVDKLEQTFPDKLEDLELGYRKLLEDNYHFPESNIEARFQKIREALHETTSDLASLDLDKVESGSQDIQEQIDSLYDIFEREIAAHQHVKKTMANLPDYLKHVQANNQKLADEVTRLLKYYILEDGVTNAIQSFTKDLKKVEEKVLPTLDELSAQEKPYSELAVIFDNATKSLQEVETGQMALYESLKDLEQAEVRAREQLDSYINKLHVIKRYMEKRHLPGIPDEFLSVFFTTSSQQEALMEELSRGRIDIATVSRLVQASSSAMEHLENTTYQVVQNATLTEQLLQYSNRYRSFDQNVQTSFEHALKLFEEQYDYRSAFEEMSYALELVEPGVTERFVSSYEKTKEKIRF